VVPSNGSKLVWQELRFVVSEDGALPAKKGRDVDWESCKMT